MSTFVLMEDVVMHVEHVEQRMLNVMYHCCLVSYQRTLYILVLTKLLVFKTSREFR